SATALARRGGRGRMASRPASAAARRALPSGAGPPGRRVPGRAEPGRLTGSAVRRGKRGKSWLVPPCDKSSKRNKRGRTEPQADPRREEAAGEAGTQGRREGAGPEARAEEAGVERRREQAASKTWGEDAAVKSRIKGRREEAAVEGRVEARGEEAAVEKRVRALSERRAEERISTEARRKEAAAEAGV